MGEAEMGRFRGALVAMLTLAAILGRGNVQAASTPGAEVMGWTPGVTEGVAPGSAIGVYFNRPMNAASLRAAWSLTPSVPGTLRTGIASLTFTPSGGLRPSTHYHLSISGAARSLSGQSLRPFSAAFLTGAALHISHVAPAGGTSGVPITSAISVTFNHPIVPLSSVDAESTAPRGWSATISPAVSGHGSWLGTSTWVFHPTVSLAPSTRYTVTIGRTVRDASGDALGRPSTWSFRTVGPEVYQQSPHNGDQYVSPSTVVRVTFSQPMSHVVGQTFTVTHAGAPVAGRITWTGATLIFHSSTALQAGATYQINVSHAMKSANGRATLGKSSTWSFRVAPLPHKSWFSPAAGKTAWAMPLYPYMAPCCGYGPYRVTIVFNTPMSLSSLNHHLTIEPSVGSFQTFGFWNGRGIYRYMIDGNFDPSRSYTITLSPGIVDQFGRPLQGSVTFPFITSERFPSVALYGRNGSSGAIAFSAGQVVHAPLQVINIPKVRFTLKHVTLDALNNPGCGGCDPAGKTVRTWTVTEPIVKDRIQSPDVTIAGKGGKPLPAGLYWLKAAPVGSIPGWNPPNSNGPGPTSEVVTVNNVSLTAKSGSNGTLVWATDTRTGKPISGLKVRLADYHGLPLTTSTTDAHGLHLFANYTNRGRFFAAVVNTGSRFGIAEMNWQPNQQSPTYLQWPSWFYGSSYSSNGTYLYTDRAIYRPGQSVDVRALLWKNSDAVYSLLGKRTATLTVTSARGKQFVHRTVTLDRFGAVHASFSLPSNLPTGDTFIWIGEPRGPSASTTITVADYRKPEFVTTVTSAHPQYAQGDSASVHVKVAYVFGSPVVHQPVAWTAYATPTEQSPPGWDGYDFVDWETLWNEWSTLDSTTFQNIGPLGNPIAHGKGSTDANGKLTIRMPVNLKKEILDRTVVVEVTATDENSQSVSGRATFGEYHSDLAIGVQADSSTVTIGSPATVHIVAVHQDGTPAPNTTLTATIAKRTYTSVLKTGVGTSTQAYWQPVPHDTTVSTQTLVSGPDGKATLTFTPPDGGEYFITIAGKDAAGNPTSTSLSIDATSDTTVNWGSDNSTNIVLKPDRTQYTVGQTAHITVPSPFSNATALVTVERGGIRRYWSTTISGNAGVVDVPINLTDIPNEYITVTLYHGWRGTLAPEWRTGTAEIHVKLDPRHVQVHVSQSGGRHHPGDTVTYTVRTTVNGKPVSAELSLALVDTAILALKTETNADILQALYADQPLGVTTGSQGTISVDNMTARVNTPLAGSNTAARVPATGGGGGGGGLDQEAPVYAAAAKSAAAAPVPGAKITIRSNFQDTAYWRGNVVTSPAGTATVRVHLPDNTTTWQLDARGLTTSQAVGQATAKTLATRDLVLRPVLPRFFVQGDHLRVGVVLNNNLAKTVTARVTLSATGLTLQAKPVTVTLPAKGEHLILFPATVPTSVAAVLTARAVPSTPGVAGDAVQLPVPVHAPLTDETTATTGQVYSSTRQMVIVPKNAVTSPGALTVSVQSSITAGLGDAYGQLKPQEFESNDDVASRLLAASALHSLPQSITGLTPKQYHRLPTNITAAVQKLLDNQFYDGGWPWFSDGFIIESDPMVTADAVEALVASGRHDRLVTQALARATEFLARRSYNSSPALSARILDVLAESGSGRPPLAEKLYGNSIHRLHLDAGSLANLGDALGRSGDTTRARAVVASLDASVKASATGAHWESSNTSFYGGPPIENTIEALQALLRYAPHDPLVPAAARWLMLTRQNSGWDCNRDTGLAIAALAAYARAAGEGTADYSYRVMVQKSTALHGSYSPSSQTRVGTAKVRIATLPHGSAAPVDITRSGADSSYGTGPLYYLARLHYYLPANDIAPRDAGVSVSRRFLSLSGKPLTSIANGSAMRVELTIHTTQSLYYLEIRDPLPSGCEPIDASLNTVQQGIGPRPIYYPWARVTGVQDLTWYIQHTDLLDNRVDLDVQYLGPGTYRYTYFTQATVAGTYDVPPTHAAEHFFPEVFGRSHGQVLTVK
jgi:alpha-2-macroglobulin